MGHTERGTFNFKVRRTGSDRPFIYCEPLNSGLSFLNPPSNYLGNDSPNYRLLCLDLADNIGWDEAESLAEMLNASLKSISVTTLTDPGH